VIVVGATNRPEDVDPAILRPDRLAAQFELGLPGEESRHAIFQSKLREVPHDLTGEQLARLARETAGYSGADLEQLVTDAKRQAARRDAEAVSLEDFLTVEEFDIRAEPDDFETVGDIESLDRNRVDASPDDRLDDTGPGLQ
jgi:SpoVK/Ycf46/Vps4 family AAA+-type ATPase